MFQFPCISWHTTRSSVHAADNHVQGGAYSCVSSPDKIRMSNLAPEGPLSTRVRLQLQLYMYGIGHVGANSAGHRFLTRLGHSWDKPCDTVRSSYPWWDWEAVSNNGQWLALKPLQCARWGTEACLKLALKVGAREQGRRTGLRRGTSCSSLLTIHVSNIPERSTVCFVLSVDA